jgi:transcriptional regulator with XRE-family HTH domain
MSLLKVALSTKYEPHVLLKAWRESFGISARALSLECGFSASYISKVESGSIVPPVNNFIKIALKLQLSEQEIIYLLGLYNEG